MAAVAADGVLARPLAMTARRASSLSSCLRLLVLALALGVGSAAAEDKPPAPEPPSSIPVPEVARRADEVMALLRGLDLLAAPSPEVEAIGQRLPEMSARLTERLDGTRRMLESQPPLGTLDVLGDALRAARLELTGWIEILTRRATQLERDLARLTSVRATWTRARADARESRAPAPVIERIDSVLTLVSAARERLEARRVAILVLQDRVAREVTRCEDGLAAVADARRQAAGQLWARDTPPIWSAELRPRGGPEPRERLRVALDTGRAQLGQFVRDRTGRMLGQLALFLALAPLLAMARGRAREWGPGDARAAAAAKVLDGPVAAALVLALLASFWIYPEEPRAVRALVGIGTLLPMIAIMRRLVEPPVIPGLYAISALFLADRVRSLADVEPLLEQELLLIEMLAAAGLLAVALLSRRGREAAERYRQSRLLLAIGLGARLALLAAGVALVSGAVGNMSLARLLGSTVINSSYLALVLYAGVRVADAVVAFLLRARPLRLLQSAARHRPRLEQRAHALLGWIAVGGWGFVTLDSLGLLRPLDATVRRVLDAGATRGSMSISLGDVVAFALTVWLAYLVSSFVRFVLEEDVYPRMRLAEGVPYAISSLLNYAILLIGFLLALAALGLDANRVTIVGGALGVGIGFGLQNVVNNFVSGLIVLFERPVRVGDAVQIGDLVGEVRRIGMRSSTVRTLEGAEVIVPNAILVSDKVTNWTLSDRLRRIDVPVGVAYGSAPDQVLRLLGEVARAHPDVLAEPAPLALFLGFGDSALKFELRVWTGRLERWLIVRSELGVALYAALRGAGMEIPFPQQDVRLRREPPDPA